MPKRSISKRHSRKRRISNGVKKSGLKSKLRSKRMSKRRSRRAPKLMSRRMSRRRSRSVSRKNTYMTLSRCKEALQEKIRINMREYNEGRYVNRKQAIAVAYSQIKKKYPQCKAKI